MLNLATFFHLNLMYSSIDTADRPAVIRRCYHPLLDLATAERPVSLEATGLTLELIGSLDPGWLDRLRGKIADGAVEFIGSGYSQIIGPLVPGRVNRANLRQGGQVYTDILGRRPRVWLVNEMAYSGGLPQLLAETGAGALVMEWDNTWKGHPQWDPELRYHHQRALGCEGTELPVLWVDTIAFQKFQRMASDALDLQEWLEFWQARATGSAGQTRYAALYGSDAEVFDFRPGRYQQEGAPHPGGEWQRIAGALDRLAQLEEVRLGFLSAALDEEPSEVCSVPLRLECTRQPVVVKKQEKYNLNRWAVTGRGDLEANTACFVRAAALAPLDADVTDQQWRELLQLWSSDFRTHITAGRWQEFRKQLGWTDGPVSPPTTVAGQPVDIAPDQRRLELDTGPVRAVLDLRRGLTLQSLVFPVLGQQPALGTLPHGHFDDIAFGADFYTGHAVVQYPGRRKLTDLQACTPATTVTRHDDGSLTAGVTVQDGDLTVTKQIELPASEPRIVLSGSLELPSRQAGEIHPIHLTVVPGLLDPQGLRFGTHNGGVSEETFSLAETQVHHGAAYSTLVTAKGGLGATEGLVTIGDGRRTLVITHDPTVSALIPTLRFEPVRGGGYFLRLRYSAQEIDETFVACDRPWRLHWRVSITARLDGAGSNSGSET